MQQIFVNLPVKDLKRSMDFFLALGYSFDPRFTDASAACLVISETIYAMLITYPRFKDFTKKEIVDATKATEVLLALSQQSRAEVDQRAEAALKAGGKIARPPEDHGFMYARAIEDPDGHVWEFFWMDESKSPKK